MMNSFLEVSFFEDGNPQKGFPDICYCKSLRDLVSANLCNALGPTWKAVARGGTGRIPVTSLDGMIWDISQDPEPGHVLSGAGAR